MATYYVDPSGGSDSNAGTSFGAAWATTQKAADTAVSGDTVRLCKTATETISAILDIDTNNGALNTRGIRFHSYSSDGSTKEAGYKIQASAAITAVIEYTNIDRTFWDGVIFDANDAATYVLYNHDGDGSLYNGFENCIFEKATSHGWFPRSNNWYMSNSEIRDNGGNGIDHQTANRGSLWLYATKVHHNTGHGWDLDRTNTEIHNCLFYRNGGSGVNQSSNSGYATVTNCTFYANTSDGWTIIDSANRNPFTMINNTFVLNGRYGLLANDTDRRPLMVSNNHHYLNTSGSTDVTDALGVDLITGDPLFTSTTDGSEDFAPTASSPLINAGPNGMTIGAIPLVSGGGDSSVATVGFAI